MPAPPLEVLPCVAFLCLALSLPWPAAAQEALAITAAVIGVDDLYSSGGERLTELWQILRQDRANLHRCHLAQEGDEWDPVFGMQEMRARMRGLVQGGWTDPEAARDILRGDAWVFVTVWGKGGRPFHADVTFAR